MDHRSQFYYAQYRNNSFALTYNSWVYEAPLQTKRQALSYWTYYLKNTGHHIQVVLAAGNEIVASWIYSPLVVDTDSTIVPRIGNFAFDLNVQFNATRLSRCEDRLFSSEIVCSDGFVLDYCANNASAR